MRTGLRNTLGVVTWIALLLLAGAAFGQDAEVVVEAAVDEVATISSGDTAWLLTSTALVLMMTLPGLALFYGGLVRSKNTTEILTEVYPICGFENLEGTHLQAGFGHLFGYDAGYYGYLWSKVYGDDMWSVFEE